MLLIKTRREITVVPEIDDYVIQTEPKMLVNSKKSEK
jgi:hypothetical protein